VNVVADAGCDSSTRGLDASTALEFVQALRIATDTMRLSTIVSIYQAGESLYQHFDKVCVIYEGRMAYFGPADKAKDYFLDMGYVDSLAFLSKCSSDLIFVASSPRTVKRRLISLLPLPTLLLVSPVLVTRTNHVRPMTSLSTSSSQRLARRTRRRSRSTWRSMVRTLDERWSLL